MLKHPFTTFLSHLAHLAHPVHTAGAEAAATPDPGARVFRGIAYRSEAKPPLIKAVRTNSTLVYRGTVCEGLRAPQIAAAPNPSRKMIYRGVPYLG